jgi:hypothetical protein
VGIVVGMELVEKYVTGKPAATVHQTADNAHTAETEHATQTRGALIALKIVVIVGAVVETGSVKL